MHPLDDVFVPLSFPHSTIPESKSDVGRRRHSGAQSVVTLDTAVTLQL